MAPGENVESAANGLDYSPSPLVTHGIVANDHLIFMETLENFHHTVGNKFVIPVLDRKPLDLHLLYVEVTRRGGYDKVTSAKKWTVVSSIFMFSPKITNAPSVLKKHYFRFLYDYERVYFFRVSNNGEPSTINSPGNNEILIPTGNDESLILTSNVESHNVEVEVEGNRLSGNNEHNKPIDNIDESNIPAGNEGSSILIANDGSLITLECVLEAKLDIGELISVEINNEAFYTIIFHPIIPTIANPPPPIIQSNTTTTTSTTFAPPTNGTSTFASASSSTIVVALPTNVATGTPTPTDNTTPLELPTKVTSLSPTPTTKLDIPSTSELQPRSEARKYKRKKSGGDPNRPKRPRSGYAFFFSRKRTELSSTRPKTTMMKLTRKIAKAWKTMPIAEKMIFQKMGEEDSKRYKKEKEEYERNKMRV